MIKRIIKYGFLITLSFLLIIVVLYFTKPQILYSGFVSITSTVFQTEPYDTKNGVHPFLQNKVSRIIKDARAKGIDLRVIQGFRTIETQ